VANMATDRECCAFRHKRARGGVGWATPAAVPFTKAKLRRAMGVAREKGFRVLARPDGTLIFERDDNPNDSEKRLENSEEIIL